ncbi:hypothetical protein F5Y13DRAFT_199030 [Hypoxylon sp. FL1857]|nr:hypothetical protein F5Y13DRAFT_199030 [Hypoxylon sp. FL1857]
MDPGTILSIVQLSFSVLELGTKIAREFFGRNDRVPDKLKRLNDRLGLFHSVVKDIIQKSKEHNASSSSLAFPGADAIIETLTECKEFLRQYESATPSQRLVLLVGPDSSRIEDLDRRIMGHYAELQLLKTVDLENAFERLKESMVAMHVSQRTPSMTESPPQPELTGRFEGTPENYSMTGIANQLSFPRSPTLQAGSRNTSLPSILELPSPPAGLNYSFDVGTRRQPPSLETGPVMAYLSRTRQNTVSSRLTHIEPGSTAHSQAQNRMSTSPPSQFNDPGHSVVLRIGPQPYQFSTSSYRVLDGGNSKVIEWSNAASEITVWHFVPNTCAIPHTIPEDAKFRVFFLPRNIKHKFKIIRADNESTDAEERPEYQFSRKIDREVFQQNIRACEFLEMIRALKINSAVERDIAILVHLKVWRQNDQDDKPTFSFAAHEVGQPSHHAEFHIRWFKKTPELKGDNKLILRVNSKESDLEDGPEALRPRRLSATFGATVRKLSGSSTHGSSSRSNSRSRSSSSKAPLSVLYDYPGLEPPIDVRNLGYLEIEFKNSELRKTFIKACYEAHRPAMEAWRNNTPSPVSSQHIPSQPPSLILGPNPAPYELEDSGRYELMGDSGAHELMGDPGFQIPPPSLTTPYYPEEVCFNTDSLFAPSRTSDQDQDPGTFKDYDREPLSREPG